MQGDFVWSGASVRCSILGASHAIEITDRRISATELLTCVSPPDGAACFLSGVGNADGVVSGFSWQVHLWLGEPDAGIDGKERLEAAFPGHPGARTVLAWRVEDDALIVESVHAYPEEAAALCGRSVIRRK